MSKRSLYTTNEAIGRAFIELFPDLKDGRVHGAIRGALQNNLTTLIPDLPEDEPLSLRRQFGEFCPEEEEHYALKVIPFRAGYAPLHCLLHITDISATIAGIGTAIVYRRINRHCKPAALRSSFKTGIGSREAAE
jgi:hypothetical protein